MWPNYTVDDLRRYLNSVNFQDGECISVPAGMFQGNVYTTFTTPTISMEYNPYTQAFVLYAQEEKIPEACSEEELDKFIALEVKEGDRG